MLTLTLVIPVFNEEHQINACLDAVANQTTKPDEVIVVDNNCTDRTTEFAQKYPFVTVITEKNQGRGYARSAGFNSAKSEIIGRIDADSRIDNNWVERVKHNFENDQDLAGIAGIGVTSFIPGIQFIKTSFFTRCYFWFVHAGFRTITMWGSNMAIRRSSWQRVASKVCNDDLSVHEDQDLSLWLAADGEKIIQDNNMKITTSGQAFRYLPKVLKYRKLYLNTKKIHKNNGNLNSAKLQKLSIMQVSLGWLLSVIIISIFALLITLMFPVDYLIARVFRHYEWIK